ncbi:hypothetical protein chiPu_0008536 [Chiloscyllium punctatum]|uniref:Uncharacterized protein n=1 Tax=Chiloscyllium punctatum TaxID=137246 RepID=A0A401SI57_CHIPU|nr:hypothetical protein [Chiloscyllium punctatum]
MKHGRKMARLLTAHSSGILFLTGILFLSELGYSPETSLLLHCSNIILKICVEDPLEVHLSPKLRRIHKLIFY